MSSPIPTPAAPSPKFPPQPAAPSPKSPPVPVAPSPKSPPPTNSTSPPPASSPPPAASTPPQASSPPPLAAPPPTASSPPLIPPTISPPPHSGSTAPPPLNSTTPSEQPPPPATKSHPPPQPQPPPPHHIKSPPPPSSPKNSSGSSSNVPVGIVAGVVLASAVVFMLLILLYLCCKKKRTRKQSDHYYGPKSDSYDPYGVQQQQWQRNPAPPPLQRVASRPPQSPRPYPPPPPPPPFMSSSGGSGSNYSESLNLYPPPTPGIAFAFSKSTFTYEELSIATNGFSEANLLGQGGFGYVHKGVLPNKVEVAVKQLKAGSGQGEREFQAEVEIISRVHHKHLVSLVGYCMTGSERLLVYEFVPNNTLEFHLRGAGQPTMDWRTRMRIALGSAKGLAYLHEDCHPKIIHRDIKASNILLDLKFEAKVADFGLAKLSSDLYTHVSTRVMGTFGYLAPEYASSGKLTDKSDVFSFGVMLLELITGHRPVDTTNAYMEDSLVDWARPLLTRVLEEGNFNSIVDPRLQNNYDQKEMAQMVTCAAACVRHSAMRRPRMSQVVRALEGEVSLSDPSEGIQPGLSTVYSSHGSSDYDTSQYSEDMNKVMQMASESKLQGNTEYTSVNPVTEYGLNPSGSSSEGQQNTGEMEMGKIEPNTQPLRYSS